VQSVNLEEEMGVGGATADDVDQEMIKNVLETSILGKQFIIFFWWFRIIMSARQDEVIRNIF